MDVVDVVLVVVIMMAALVGLRLGALVQVTTFVGFVAGLTLGALVSSAVLGAVRSPLLKAFLTLSIVLGLAVLIGSAGRVAGSWCTAAVRRHHLGKLDSLLGVGVSVVAVLLTAWLVANIVSFPNSRFTWLSAQVGRSNILRSVEAVLPPVPSVYSHVQSLLGAAGFPEVTVGLTPPISGSVPAPTVAQAQALAGPVESSTVKIVGQACGVIQEGSGFVVAPGLVVTNAHVVAGEPSTQVEVGQAGYPATPVYYDPEFDLAVLRTAAPMGRPLTVAGTEAPRGTRGAVLGYPEDGGLTVDPAGVGGGITAEGRDIYNGGLVVRRVLELDAVIRPGNSGGPLIGPDGSVIGVVFSRSTADSNVGYALASPGVLSRVRQAETGHARVGTGACVSG